MENKVRIEKKLLGFLLIGLMIMAVACDFSPDRMDKLESYQISKDFVRASLKTPSKAKFLEYGGVTVEALGGRRFRVYSYVDSQNSFGAQIRTQYVCVVDMNSERVESIDW